MIFGKTDRGRVRRSNQDMFYYKQLFKNCCFAVVCDGMGGVNGGAVASEIALKNIKDCFLKRITEDIKERSVKELLKSAFLNANQSICNRAAENKSLKGMGTTAIAAIIIKDSVYIGYVGDSRGYLFSDGTLTQLTCDHSYVQMLLKNGEIDASEAKKHPRRNEITKALGVSDSSQPDFVTHKLNEGDRILLCSDGLTNMCSDEEISEIMRSCDGVESVNRLISLANQNGGQDNITVIVME